jgi:hypothetical protein
MTQDPSIYDQFSKGIADAITDIREKVVEEPWFGRAVNDRDSTPQWPAAKEPEPSKDKSEHTREQEKPVEKEPDKDMDR